MKKTTDTEIQEYLDHFNPTISAELVEYIREDVFLYSRYIFTRRDGHRRYGYCTHCNTEFLIPKNSSPKPISDPTLLVNVLKFDQPRYKSKSVPTMQCPNCGSTCRVKASGRSRRYMIDSAYCVWYEKSVKNPDAVVARGIQVIRDYRDDYKNIETQYRMETLYVFEIGNCVMLKADCVYHQTEEGFEREFIWVKRSKVFPLYKELFIREFEEYRYSPYSTALIYVGYSRDSIKEAIAGTSYQYSTWESYYEGDMVQFFDLYSKYPCIEYMTKMGFDKLVREKLEGYATYHTVNWKGKSPLKVLKLSKQEIKEIRSHNITISFRLLDFMRSCKKQKSDLSIIEMAEIHNAGYFSSSFYEEMFKSALEFTTIRKAHNYLKKQASNKHINSPISALQTWRDYLGDCIKLGLDLTDESTLFPRDLYTAHQNTIEQIKHKSNIKLNKALAERVKKLTEKYYFEHEELMCRPARSTNELIDEGKALHHCVGTYADRYTRGENVLLVIRKMSAPDQPYFTVELRNDYIVQVRGLRNCAPNKKVEQFLAAFKKNILEKKKQRPRVRVSA